MSAITFTSIEAPGALESYDFKPNNDGHVAGYFTDATGNHGFLLAGGTFIPINVPGATSTYAFGLNNQGQIGGYYTGDTGDHGFLATHVPELGAVYSPAAGLWPCHCAGDSPPYQSVAGLLLG